MSLDVDGAWPARVTITRGWSRAVARRWNDESDAGYLQLLRGGSDFLAQATDVVAERGDGRVYSPALYPSATRVWRRAGYVQFDRLLMMERALASAWPSSLIPVVVSDDPDWEALERVDMTAFQGFWRLGARGLQESVATTPDTAVMTTVEEDDLVGFAIVGADRGLGYLQRIAVSKPGRGHGSALLAASLQWARSQGCRAMLLNVRRESEPARRLYERFGFEVTTTGLDILVHTSGPELN
jgi:ribosomal-protein-alanine N-acetyltransferase